MIRQQDSDRQYATEQKNSYSNQVAEVPAREAGETSLESCEGKIRRQDKSCDEQRYPGIRDEMGWDMQVWKNKNCQ